MGRHLENRETEDEVGWAQPYAKEDDWCGEWRSKETVLEGLDEECEAVLQEATDRINKFFPGILDRGQMEEDVRVLSQWLEHGRVSDGMREKLKEGLALLRKQLGMK